MFILKDEISFHLILCFEKYQVILREFTVLSYMYISLCVH